MSKKVFKSFKKGVSCLLKTTFVFTAFISFFISLPGAGIAQVFNITAGDVTAFQTALTTAQSNVEDDTINLAPGLYNVTETLTYITSDGDSGHTITILGNGAVLDGGSSVQILSLNTDEDANSGDPGGDALISGITFQNGYSNSVAGGGAYIYSSQSYVTVTNCVFANNQTTSGGKYRFKAGGFMLEHLMPLFT